MAHELPRDRPIVIRRPGHEDFELPERHLAELSDNRKHVRLAASLEGSVFVLAGFAEEPACYVVELGGLVAIVGPPVWGDPPEPRPYPLPA